MIPINSKSTITVSSILLSNLFEFCFYQLPVF